MTKYAEGVEIFKGRLVYLGDMGNDEEQEDPTSKELFSIWKQGLSEYEVTKILSDTTDDALKAIPLILRGFGAVLLEATTKNVQEQFQDRSVIWSPTDNPEVKEEVVEIIKNDFERMNAQSRFDKKRTVVACAIELLAERMEKEEGYYEIINPFNDFMTQIFTDAGSIGFRGYEHLFILPALVTLANVFSREEFYNVKAEKSVFIVTPEDFIYTLKRVGRSLSFMLSDTKESTLPYIQFIEDNYVRSTSWDYNWDEYDKGFNRKLGGTEQNLFDAFVSIHPGFTRNDIQKTIKQSNKTVLGHLNDLHDYGLIYRKSEDGKPNHYYPVNDFEELSRTFGASFLTDEEIDELITEIIAIYEIYIKDREREGLIKK